MNISSDSFWVNSTKVPSCCLTAIPVKLIGSIIPNLKLSLSSSFCNVLANSLYDFASDGNTAQLNTYGNVGALPSEAVQIITNKGWTIVW